MITDPPPVGGEREQLNGFLDFLRDAVRAKCTGLSDADARRSLLPSPLTTVAGLLSHLCWVEAYWFRKVLDGQADAAPYDRRDPDAEFRVPPGKSLDSLLADYADECRRSREIAAALPLDHVASLHGKADVNVRWVLIHMIEETGRHAGHLDILREMLDGATGE